jgi:hypothetical protein
MAFHSERRSFRLQLMDAQLANATAVGQPPNLLAGGHTQAHLRLNIGDTYSAFSDLRIRSSDVF